MRAVIVVATVAVIGGGFMVLTEKPASYSNRDRAQLTKFVKQIEKRRLKCVKLADRGHAVPYCMETWGL